MTKKISLRLDKFQKLPYATKKNLLYFPNGRRVGALFIADLSRCDIVRIVDCFGDVFLLEVIDPTKKLVWIRQFPPISEMRGWEERTNWRICQMNFIEQEEDCFFYTGPEKSVLARISKPRVIRILEERKRRLPNY